ILPGILGGYRPPNVSWVALDTTPHRHIFFAMRHASAQHPAVAAVAAALQPHAQKAAKSRRYIVVGYRPQALTRLLLLFLSPASRCRPILGPGAWLSGFELFDCRIEYCKVGARS